MHKTQHVQRGRVSASQRTVNSLALKPHLSLSPKPLISLSILEPERSRLFT